MKRLPAAKRNQLIGVLIGTVGLICVVYFLLIDPQNTKNRNLALQINKESARLADFKKVILAKENTTTNLVAMGAQLVQAEQDVAYGDINEWTYDIVRRLKASAPKLELSAPSPGQLGDCDLIAGFPYKQIRIGLTGTAHYHALGKFISDFENKYPHCRVLNVAADPAGSGPGSGEKLNFRMDIVALVKPNSQ
jgi:hypothetical protein